MNQKTTIIFGMAKSSLNFKGAKQQKSELDLLRLLYTVQNLEKNKINSFGYFMVAQENLNRVKSWIEKYGFKNNKNNIQIIPFQDLDYNEIIKAEKIKNAGAVNKDNPLSKENASALLGQKLYEECLAKEIKIRHGVEPILEQKRFGVKWDFYYEN